MHVLVTYFSWKGSTAEIAERVGAILADEGISVDVTPVQNTPSSLPHDAFIIGSAVHNQAWSPQAVEFVHQHAPALSQHPTWAFSVGMSGGFPRPLRRLASSAQDRRVTQSLFPDIHPKEHRVFSGVARPEDFPRWVRVLVRMIGGRLGDYRDWHMIETWSRHIAGQLNAGKTAGMN